MPEVTVNIQTPDDTVIEDTVIPGDYLTEQIVLELVDELNLPYLTDNGQPITYSLFHINQNLPIPVGKTLPDSGVRSGDTIKLVSSEPVTLSGESNRLIGTEAAENLEDGMIEVSLSVLDLNNREYIKLQMDAKVEDIIRHVVTHYDLPSRGSTYEPITYRLASKALGRFLSNWETVQQAGIPRLDRLTLHREEVAGANYVTQRKIR